MDTVLQNARVEDPSSSQPTRRFPSNNRHRRMAIHAPPPDFDIQCVHFDPDLDLNLPPSPPVPPRSPLRPGARSVASFKSLLDHYTHRDSTASLPVPSSPLKSVPSLSTILNTYNPKSPLLTPSPSLEKAFSTDSKPLPPPPPDSECPLESMTGDDSDDVCRVQTSLSAQTTPIATPVPKRTHALNELLMSERAYASDLAFIRDTHIPLALGQPVPFQYPPPLTPPGSSGSSSRTLSTASDSSTSSNGLGPPMTREDVKIIFGNIADIAVFSETFADHLEDALGQVLVGGKCEDWVGKLFLEIIPQIESLYKTYITRHPMAIGHLNNLKPTPSLTAYLAQTKTLATSVTHAWDLPSLLIKPVQRLLKYSLLLTTIIQGTPDGHGDKPSLIQARDKMEEVARGVNEGRRRLEIVKEVLMGKGEGLALKKKISVGKSPSVTLERMKSMRLTRPKETSEEAERVELLEEHLKKCRTFIHEFAKNAVNWAKTVGSTVGHLRSWATVFGTVIGLSEHQPSEAFNAFLCVIDDQLGPLCVDLNDSLQKDLFPQLTKLFESTRLPMRLLSAMHSYETLHHSLVNMNYSKTRPPPALVESSQSFLALRAQLHAELPTYLELLHRGVVACIRDFANMQTRFWGDARDRWQDLWDALRIEGETNGGSEETLRVWWDRFQEVDELVSKLTLVSRNKLYVRSTFSRSSGAVSTLGSPFCTVAPLPESPTAPVSHAGPSNSTRHRSMGSLDAGSSHMRSKPSANSLRTRSQSHNRNSEDPTTARRMAMSRTNTSSPSTSNLSSSSLDRVPRNGHGGSYPNHLQDVYTWEDSETASLSSARGRNRSPPNFRRRLSETLKTPLRRSPSQKSTGSTTSLGARRNSNASTRGTPSVSERQREEEVPPLPANSDVGAHTPAKYVVRAIHPCTPPEGATFMTMPFFEMRCGEYFEVLAEAGHPSEYEDLPLDVDGEDDCLLVVRDEGGQMGWALASFLVPVG